MEIYRCTHPSNGVALHTQEPSPTTRSGFPCPVLILSHHPHVRGPLPQCEDMAQYFPTLDCHSPSLAMIQNRVVFYEAMARLTLNASSILSAGQALQGSQRLRVAYVVRDPLSIVLSGYLYHLTTIEAWARESSSSKPPVSAALCRTFDDLAFLCPVLGGMKRDLSYQAVLRELPPRLGVFAEALMTRYLLMKIRNTVLELSAAKPYGIVSRFEDLTGPDSRAAFQLLFAALGVTDQDAALRAIDFSQGHGTSSKASLAGIHGNSNEGMSLGLGPQPSQHCLGRSAPTPPEVAQPCGNPESTACWLSKRADLSATKVFQYLHTALDESHHVMPRKLVDLRAYLAEMVADSAYGRGFLHSLRLDLGYCTLP